ncbi:MAG: hypothetical protein KTR20_06805 [Cellvibrionaceae bacterium]|nr:hypothetical protein [Cellvibrionaceae bacterium]
MSGLANDARLHSVSKPLPVPLSLPEHKTSVRHKHKENHFIINRLH